MFLLALAVLLATAHGFGHVFARLRQPRVVGEIISGVCLVLGVAPLFGAFVAGIITQTEDAQLQQAQQAFKQFASLIPMYFALVGLRLDHSTGFDVWSFGGGIVA